MKCTHLMKLVLSATLALLLSAALPVNSTAPTPPRLGARSTTLQEQLEKGLRTRRPEEHAFIDRVVKMVKQRQLPEPMVRSTFDWARNKKPYQFPYFERAIKIRAARIGIVVR